MVDENKKLEELEKLNIELMDSLVAASIGFLRYCNEHNIHFSGLDGLASLVARAGRICEEIGDPYDRNPILGPLKKKHGKSYGLHFMFVVLILSSVASHSLMLSTSSTETLQHPSFHVSTVNLTLPLGLCPRI